MVNNLISFLSLRTHKAMFYYLFTHSFLIYYMDPWWKIGESQLVKRVDDLLRKWCCVELDQLQEMSFPPELCNQNPADKDLNGLNPFEGDTLISAQLTRLWKLLSNLQLVRPIMQQFYLDRIIEGIGLTTEWKFTVN